MPQTAPTASDRPSAASDRLYLQYLAFIPLVVIVAALYFARPVFVPFAVAVLVAFALAPLVDRLHRLGLGRTSAVLIASVVAIGFFVGLGLFVASRTVQLADELPRYENNLIHKVQSVRGTALGGNVFERAAAMVRDIRAQFTGSRLPTTPQERTATQTPSSEPVAVKVQPLEPEPLEIAANLLGSVLVALLSASIVGVFVIFILLYKEDIRDRFIRLAGSRDLQRTTLLLDEGAERLGRYLLTQTAINASFGAIIGLGVWLIGIPNPLLWGLMTAILRFVPYIGVPLAAMLPVVLALAVDPGWSMGLETLALYFVGEIIFGQAVEPLLYSRGLGLSAPAIVIAATFWTWLWGPIGLLLSTPLTMCLVVLGRHVPHLEFLDVLFGDRPPLSAEEALYIRLLSEDAEEAAVEAEAFIAEASLVRYYDEVVVKALLIAQADVNRGVLDGERIERIVRTTEALIQDLAEDRPAPAEGLPVHRPQLEGLVLCIGGRGGLDDAAALLLVDLLQKANVTARLARRDIDSAAPGQKLNIADAKVVCLGYLDSANANRARYFLRRLKRGNPDAQLLAAFWGDTDAKAQKPETIGAEIVTRLEEAVEAILSAGRPPAEPRAPAPAFAAA